MIRQFVSEGATDEELSTKKTTLDGLYKVGLSTTLGLAQTMHAHYRNGFEPGYLDEYPKLIRSLTVSEVNAAIARYLHPERMVTAIAGSIPV
jgi:zinc protease